MGKCNYMTLNIILYLISSLQVLIHYLGNEKAAQDFPHGNQKKNPDRKYCQQCPSTIGCQQGVVNVFDSGSKYVTQPSRPSRKLGTHIFRIRPVPSRPVPEIRYALVPRRKIRDYSLVASVAILIGAHLAYCGM